LDSVDHGRPRSRARGPASQLTPDAVLDYVVGAAARGGATVADLALRAGLSRSQAADRLAGLPARLVRTLRTEAADGALRYVPAMPAEPAAAAAAWERFRAAARTRRRRTVRPRRIEEIAAAAASARAQLALGDFEGLRRTLGQPVSDPVLARRLVPPRDRDGAAALLHGLRADVAMQLGQPHAAERHVCAALACERDPLRRAELWAVRGAALRMVGRPPEAIGAFEQASAALRQVAPNIRTHLRWNVAASAVAPLLAAARFDAASEHARIGRHAAEDLAGWAETAVRTAQVALAREELGTAERALDEVHGRPDMPHYLRGWVARVAAGLLRGVHERPAWNAQLCAAWVLCRGYGFQGRLLVARLAAAPERFLPELWPAAARHQLAAFVARLHAERHRQRPSECPACRCAPLPERAAHALGFPPGTLPLHYAT
jgi:tetratricopeptide (TPR) repeat protein